MLHWKKNTSMIALLLVFIFTVFSACAVPAEPTPSAGIDSSDITQDTTFDTILETSIPEETTVELLEEITHFKVLTELEKSQQRNVRTHNRENPLRAWDLAETAKECPYTTEEILSQISLGDNILNVYEKIGYPTYRDTPDSVLSSRLPDIYFMTYTTTDGDVVSIEVDLAGCCTEDYRYVVVSFASSREGTYHIMDFDTMVRCEVIPLFMAVEQVGVDYLLEREIITPYEATLYAAEEAVYQTRMADKAETSTE